MPLAWLGENGTNGTKGTYETDGTYGIARASRVGCRLHEVKGT